MKNAFYFILGVILITLVSATTVSVMTIKPSVPKTTIAVEGYGAGELNINMKPFLNKGYIVKNIAHGNGSRMAVIMEKY